MNATDVFAKEESLLSLETAVKLINGEILQEQLTEGQKAQIIGELEKENEITIFSCTGNALTYTQEKELVIEQSVRLDGNGVRLIGKTDTAFHVKSSRVQIENLKFEGFYNTVWFDGGDKPLQNSSISRCDFSDYITGVLIGSSKSGGRISDLTVEECSFTGVDGIENEKVDGFSQGLRLHAAVSDQGQDISDAVCENVMIRNNRWRQGCRLGINMAAGSEFRFFPSTQAKFCRCDLKNVTLEGNDLKGCWDATINAMFGYHHNTDCTFENLTIARNRLVFAIWGIFLGAGEPTFGSLAENCIIRNNQVHGYRYMIWAVGGNAGEQTAARGNYVGEHIILENNSYENGEGHIMVQDNMSRDWATMEDNKVLADLKKMF